MNKRDLILIPFFAFLGLLAFALAPANSDTGACYTINDADARAYCIARARKDPGQCYTVQRADLRAQCLAEVRK